MPTDPHAPLSFDAADETCRRLGRQPVVLQIVPSLVTGGVERGTVDMAKAIVQAGWKAVVASEGGPMVRELTRGGAEHVVLPLASKNPWVIHRNIKRLEALIKEVGADIVHARSRAPAWSAKIAAANCGAHFVTTFHGTYTLGGYGLKRMYNSVMASGERVIAISHFISEHIQRLYGVAPDRIRVIHRGIDMNIFNPANVSQERIIALAQKWRLPDGYKVIMLPGRLTRWKGQKVLIEALSLLGRHDIRCLLVGSDQGRTGYRKELTDMIAAHDIADVVHIVDECNDMPAAYMLTDVAISASTDPEAFGRVVVEAQAMGRPVIVSDHGAPRETVIPDETGWLVEQGNAMALAQALKHFLSLSEQDRFAMANTAKSFVRQHFTREKMCADTLDVYREVLGNPIYAPAHHDGQAD